MAKPIFSIVPDSLINIGTGFGVLLGLAVGLLTGLMTTPATTTEISQVNSSLPTAIERTDAALRTLMIQRVNLIADIARLDAASTASTIPQQHLAFNSDAIARVVRPLGSSSAATALVKALDDQASRVRNIVILAAKKNQTGATEEKTRLSATSATLTSALANFSGVSATAKPIAEKLTISLMTLAETADEPQKTYGVEATAVTAVGELATYLRSTAR